MSAWQRFGDMRKRKGRRRRLEVLRSREIGVLVVGRENLGYISRILIIISVKYANHSFQSLSPRPDASFSADPSMRSIVTPTRNDRNRQPHERDIPIPPRTLSRQNYAPLVSDAFKPHTDLTAPTSIS